MPNLLNGDAGKTLWKGYSEEMPYHPEPDLPTIRKIPRHQSAFFI